MEGDRGAGWGLQGDNAAERPPAGAQQAEDLWDMP